MWGFSNCYDQKKHSLAVRLEGELQAVARTQKHSVFSAAVRTMSLIFLDPASLQEACPQALLFTTQTAGDPSASAHGCTFA